MNGKKNVPSVADIQGSKSFHRSSTATTNDSNGDSFSDSGMQEQTFLQYSSLLEKKRLKRIKEAIVITLTQASLD